MTLETLGAFVLFVALMTGSPGPGNLTFMAIGSSAGFRVAFPVILAAMLGVVVVNLCVALGLGGLMAQGGVLFMTFSAASMLYMTYLAWRIINLSIQPKGTVSVPSFREGLLIHPLSPKSWAMSLVGYTSFFAANDQSALQNAVMLAAGFVIGGIVSHSIWALVGVSILKALGDGKVLRTVIILMAASMLGVTAWSLWPG